LLSRSQPAKALAEGKVPDKCSMIGRHAKALFTHSHLLADALKFAGMEQMQDRENARFALRCRLLHQLLPLWLKTDVRACFSVMLRESLTRARLCSWSAPTSKR
jgi:hypothetical protein